MLTTLVSIYDSKDLFVKELQVLLAQRLLAIQDGNYDREVRILTYEHYSIFDKFNSAKISKYSKYDLGTHRFKFVKSCFVT